MIAILTPGDIERIEGDINELVQVIEEQRKAYRKIWGEPTKEDIDRITMNMNRFFRQQEEHMIVIDKQGNQYTQMRTKPRSAITPVRFTTVQLIKDGEAIVDDPEFEEVRPITKADQHMLGLVFGRQIKFKSK